jgi:hypothetical protein
MEAGNRLWKRATVYGSGQPFMEAGNRLWKRATVYGSGFVNSLTMKKIFSIIINKHPRRMLTSPVMSILEAGAHFF